MRINKVVTRGKMPSSVYKILSTNSLRNSIFERLCIYELIKFKLLNFQTLNYGEFESGYWGLRD